MTRLLFLVERPSRLSRQEADTWLRSGFEPLAVLDPVQLVEISPLDRAGEAWSTAGDYLIEVQVSSRDAARQVLHEPEVSALLADFRRLGMHPSVQVTDG